jgi:hypothetical protein
MQPTRWPGAMTTPQHAYEVRPRKDKRGFDLISDALPFSRFWYGEPDAISHAVNYAKFFSRSHDAVIRVYDESGQCDRDARARGRVQTVVKVARVSHWRKTNRLRNYVP